jgi:hypothetical protein
MGCLPAPSEYFSGKPSPDCPLLLSWGRSYNNEHEMGRDQFQDHQGVVTAVGRAPRLTPPFRTASRSSIQGALPPDFLLALLQTGQALAIRGHRSAGSKQEVLAYRDPPCGASQVWPLSAVCLYQLFATQFFLSLLGTATTTCPVPLPCIKPPSFATPPRLSNSCPGTPILFWSLVKCPRHLQSLSCLGGDSRNQHLANGPLEGVT